jgi:enamine deaminase RidA (YjgF/YER057c/UK114 family)
VKRAVKTDIPKHGRPFEWGIVADGTLYTAAAPMKADGTLETGNIRKQITLALSNLAKVLKSAGGTMADVTQTMLYVTDRSYIDPITEVWAKAFPKPYPNRATVVVNEIGLKGVGLVVLVTACIGSGRTKPRPVRKTARKTTRRTTRRR